MNTRNTGTKALASWLNCTRTKQAPSILSDTKKSRLKQLKRTCGQQMLSTSYRTISLHRARHSRHNSPRGNSYRPPKKKTISPTTFNSTSFRASTTADIKKGKLDRNLETSVIQLLLSSSSPVLLRLFACSVVGKTVNGRSDGRNASTFSSWGQLPPLVRWPVDLS